MAPENNQEHQQQPQDITSLEGAVPPVYSQVQPQPPNSPPAGKSKKKLIAILILLAIIVLGGIAFAIFWFGSSNGDNSTPQNNVVQRQQDVVNPDNLAEKLKGYAEEVSNRYPQYSNIDMYTGNENRSITVFTEDIDGFVGLSSEKDGWSGKISRPSEGSNGPSNDTAAYEYLLQLFKNDGFSEYDGELYNNEWQSGEPLAVLSSSGIICEVSMSGSDQLFLACAELADLPELAKSLKPFYDAYVSTSEDIDRHTIIIDIRTIDETDRFQEYETARGSVSNSGYGAAVFFYRHNQGEWQYGYGGHDSPDCSKFTNEDMRRAFYKEECYSSSDMSDHTTSTVGEYFGL